MSWNTIATSDALDELSPQEVAAFNTIQGGSTTQANILTRVVNETRGYITAGGGNLDAAGTIPDQLRNQVIDIALWRWLKKFPALKNLQTKERKDAFDSAIELLEKVSRGEIKIELPNAVTALNTAAPVNAIQQASGERRQFTRRKLRGL